MELVAVASLNNGMETAEDVLDLKGNVIIPANTVINKTHIQKLSISNILCINVKEPEDYCETYFEKIKVSKSFDKFYQLYNSDFEEYKHMIDKFVNDGIPMDNNRLIQMVKNISSPFQKSKVSILDMLSVLKIPDKDFVYSHAMNVALICEHTAKWFGLDDEEHDVLILCGLYYDIGKFKIPLSVLTKQGKLTTDEFKLTKNHTLYGYQMLLNCDIDMRIKSSALMHHERIDGSGYPQGLTGDTISKFAKIIALLDSYEAMTSYRSYRDPLCPFKVIEIFEKDGYGKYDTAFYMTFLERMVEEYIGKEVQLNDGTICTVLLINKQHYSKPMVKTQDEQYIDLSSKTELYISSLI